MAQKGCLRTWLGMHWELAHIFSHFEIGHFGTRDSCSLFLGINHNGPFWVFQGNWEHVILSSTKMAYLRRVKFMGQFSVQIWSHSLSLSYAFWAIFDFALELISIWNPVCRRIVPGQFLAYDPKGRAVMIAACEKQKLVYILNRDGQARLTISSPLEAHKSNTIHFRFGFARIFCSCCNWWQNGPFIFFFLKWAILALGINMRSWIDVERPNWSIFYRFKIVVVLSVKMTYFKGKEIYGPFWYLYKGPNMWHIFVTIIFANHLVPYHFYGMDIGGSTLESNDWTETFLFVLSHIGMQHLV